MKRFFHRFLTGFFVFTLLNFALCSYSCGQNGPTPPSVVLTWLQCVPATGNTVTINNVYRAAGTGTPAPPAVFTSSAPITTWTDTSVVRGSGYTYAATCSDNKGNESGYSNTANANVPTTPGGITPPVQNSPKPTKAPVKGAPNGLKATVL